MKGFLSLVMFSKQLPLAVMAVKVSDLSFYLTITRKKEKRSETEPSAYSLVMLETVHKTIC